MINLDDIKVVSFDIFDTSLIRDVFKPTDVFKMVETELNYPGFINARIKAELAARAIQKRCNREDISYDDIYNSFLQPDFGAKAKELEVEARVLRRNEKVFDIYQHWIQRGVKIIFTSDMYLPVSFLENILRKNGYNHWDKLYISGSIGKCKTGSLFPYIINDLRVKPEEILHIGDNYYSDILKPKSLGLKVYYIANNVDVSMANRRIKDIKLLSNYDVDVVASSLFMNLITRCENSDKDLLYKLGYLWGGLLYNFTKWAIQKSNGKKCFFVARDGWIPYQIATNILGYKNCHYIYTSRKAIMLCKLDTSVPIDAPENKEIFEAIKNLRYNKVRELLEFVGLNPEEFKETVKQAGFTSLDECIISFRDNRPQINEKLTKLIKLIQNDIYYKVIPKKTKAAKKYFDSFNIENDDALIDVGYFGKCQHAMEYITGKKLNGLYLETYEFAHLPRKNMKMTGFISTGANITNGYGGVIELFFSSSEEGTEDYNDLKPVFEKGSSPNELKAFVNAVSKGSIDFCRDWHAIKGNYELDDELVKAVVLRFLFEPTMEEINYFNNFRIFINGSSEHKSDIVNFNEDLLKSGDLKNAYNESYWRRAFRIKLRNSKYNYLENIINT